MARHTHPRQKAYTSSRLSSLSRGVRRRLQSAVSAELEVLERRTMFTYYSLSMCCGRDPIDGSLDYSTGGYYIDSAPPECPCQTNGVTPANGSASTPTPSLISDLGGIPFNAAQVVTNSLAADDGGTGADGGTNTLALGVPLLTESVATGVGTLTLVDGPTTQLWFNLNSGTDNYVERYGGNDALTLDSSSDPSSGQFTATLSDGTAWTFNGFNGSVLDGTPIKETSPGGLVTSFNYDATGGHLESVTRSIQDGAETVSEQFLYSYTDGSSSTTTDNRISSIELERQQSSPSATSSP
jgi:hypothetical protein